MVYKIIQLFNWDFVSIKSKLRYLSLNGTTHVLCSPPSLSHPSAEWWGRYQPIHYFIIAGPLGSKKDFIDMCSEAKNVGISIMVDTVLNHMADHNLYEDFEYGKVEDLSKHPYWESFKSDYYTLSDQRKMRLRRDHFFTNSEYGESIKDYGSREEVLYKNLGTLPDLDTEHPDVLRYHTEYLDFLIELGVTSIRLDATKHMPESYVKELMKYFLSLSKDSKSIILCEIISHNYADYEKYNINEKIVFYNFPLQDLAIKFLKYKKLGLNDFIKSIPRRSDLGLVDFVTNHDYEHNDCFKYHRFVKEENKNFLLKIFDAFALNHQIIFVDKNQPLRLHNQTMNGKIKHVFNYKNFWIGHCEESKKLLFLNATPYQYRIHPSWPNCFDNNSISSGTYIDPNDSKNTLNILSTKFIQSPLFIPPHNVMCLVQTKTIEELCEELNAVMVKLSKLDKSDVERKTKIHNLISEMQKYL